MIIAECRFISDEELVEIGKKYCDDSGEFEMPNIAGDFLYGLDDYPGVSFVVVADREMTRKEIAYFNLLLEGEDISEMITLEAFVLGLVREGHLPPAVYIISKHETVNALGAK